MEQKSQFIRPQTYLLLLITLCLLLGGASVSAKQVVLDSDLDLLEINYPLVEAYPINQNITLYFHVVNSSGNIQDNSSLNCSIHFYDPYGFYVLEDNLSYSDDDFYIEVDKSTITEPGFYSYFVSCENKESGYVSVAVDFTNDGRPIEAKNVLAWVFAQAIIFAFYLILSYLNMTNSKNDMDKFSFWIGVICMALAIAQLLIMLAYVDGNIKTINTAIFSTINITSNIILLLSFGQLTYIRLFFRYSDITEDKGKWED